MPVGGTASVYWLRVTPLSAVLITLDEEPRLAAALESVRFCDEIVVVDAGSTDRTRELAAAAGARVLVNAPWPGFVAQRNHAVAAARHDWVLAVDADERVTPGAARGDRGAARGRLRRTPATGSRASPSTSGAGSAAPTGIPTRSSACSTAAAGAGRAGWSTSRCASDGPVGRLRHDLEHHTYDGRRRPPAPPSTATRRCGRGRRTRTGGARARSTAAWPRRGPSSGTTSLRRGFLLGEAGLTVSDAQRVLHLREAGQAARARARGRPRGDARDRVRVLHVDTAAGWRGRTEPGAARPPPGMARRGHEVAVACRARRRAREARAVRGPRRAPPSLSAATGRRARPGGSRAWRARFRPDVVHAHDPHAHRGRARGLRAPRVASRRVDFPVRGAASRWKYARCGRVVAVSRAVADVLGSGGVDPARVRLVYEGVPDRRAAAGRPRRRWPRWASPRTRWSSGTWPRSPTTRTTRRC